MFSDDLVTPFNNFGYDTRGTTAYGIGRGEVARERGLLVMAMEVGPSAYVCGNGATEDGSVLCECKGPGSVLCVCLGGDYFLTFTRHRVLPVHTQANS